MSAPVYLDNAATTRVDPRVAARMHEVLAGEASFGNPGSSTHAYGEAASALVERARQEVAVSCGATAHEVIFTSGATEANNLAIFGVAQYYRDQGRHVITAQTEHKAVLGPCRELERQGWRVTYLRPDTGGRIAPEQLAAALRDDTVLVSLMHVNNEVGLIQDPAALAAVCARHGTARLHVDAAQSLGKVPVDFTASGADLMSVSAHKAYGPKGVGALLVSRVRGVQLAARQLGGGQERGIRAGTLAPHQLAGMGMAFRLAVAEGPAECGRLGSLRERLWNGLAELGDVWRNGAAADTVPQLLNVAFGGVEGESLMAAVNGTIAVSSGSACDSASGEPSYVLRALGRNERLAEASLRFGLGRFTTEADIDHAIVAVVTAVRRLRRVAGG